jgi:hypothetical protein
MKKEDYIKIIDERYLEAKKERLSRINPKWGKWSAEMNRELRARIESKKDPEELALKYVIIYWTLRSKMLELHHKSKFFGKNKIKKLGKEALEIKEMIITGKGLSPLTFQEAARKVL